MSAKPCLVLFAAYAPSRGTADALAAELGAVAAGLDDEVAADASVIAAEDLDLPGVGRMLGRFGVSGVIPE